MKAAVLCERDNGIVRIRGDRHAWSEPYQIRPYDSMLSEFADPHQAPEVLRVREQIRSWRFYDHVRTDAAAPARASQIGTRTPVMSHDGADVAAALQTIRETGAAATLDQAIDLAFPGSHITVESVIQSPRLTPPQRVVTTWTYESQEIMLGAAQCAMDYDAPLLSGNVVH